VDPVFGRGQNDLHIANRHSDCQHSLASTPWRIEDSCIAGLDFRPAVVAIQIAAITTLKVPGETGINWLAPLPDTPDRNVVLFQSAFSNAFNGVLSPKSTFTSSLTTVIQGIEATGEFHRSIFFQMAPLSSA